MRVIAAPGTKICHGTTRTYWNAVWSIRPQVAVGGGGPAPRNANPASASRAKPRLTATWMISGEATLGSTWRAAMRPDGVPTDRAASM